MHTPLAPRFNVVSNGNGPGGGSCETRKLRNAEFCAHSSTLHLEVRGVPSAVVLAMLAALFTPGSRKNVVANFPSSTVADVRSLK